MQIGMRGRLTMALAGASLLAMTAGCEEEKKQGSGPADAGLDAGSQQAVIGGKLGEAAAAAAAGNAPKAPAGAGTGAAQGGPPESGVFAPGAAEAVLPKGVPYKLEMLGEGSEPRVRLAPRIDPKAEQKRQVVIGLRSAGQQGLPSFEIELAFKPDKPKDKPRAGDDKARAGEGADQASGGVAVTGKVVSVIPAAMGLGGPPKELTDTLGKLKGSLIRYRITPAGAPGDLTIEAAKEADAGIAPLLDALGEALTTLSTPMPDKPVGVGAYWMVADRAVWQMARIPVLRYRVFKITKIDGDAVSFSVDTRQYAEENTVRLPTGGAQDVTTTLDAFESSGKGTLVWDPGALAPRDAELQQRVQVRLVPPGSPAGSQQRMLLQSELSARFQAPAAPPP